MTSRRELFLALLLGALLPISGASRAAEESGLRDLLGGMADAAARRYAEKYRDESRWDGKYYYDNYDNSNDYNPKTGSVGSGK